MLKCCFAQSTQWFPDFPSSQSYSFQLYRAGETRRIHICAKHLFQATSSFLERAVVFVSAAAKQDKQNRMVLSTQPDRCMCSFLQLYAASSIENSTGHNFLTFYHIEDGIKNYLNIAIINYPKHYSFYI